MTRAQALHLVVPLGLACARALADPHPMTTGATAAPAAPVEIALAREQLDIRLLLDKAIVKADLELENRGAEKQLLVGFPCEAGRHLEIAALDCGTRIAVRVDGKAVRSTLRRTKDGGDWQWTMHFAPGATTRLAVSYTTRLMNDRYDVPFYGLWQLRYRLTTGAAWAGPIGALDMRVDVPSDAIGDIGPDGVERSARHLEWHLKDVEPTDDLTILFHPVVAGPIIANEKKLRGASAGERREIADRIDRFIDVFSRSGDDMIQMSRTIFGAWGFPAAPHARITRTLAESTRLLKAQLAATTK